MPTWNLALLYWIHLLATITWLGGLVMLVFVVWPHLLPFEGETGKPYRTLFHAIEKRFRPFTNISLIVLLAGGMLQMGGDEHYKGFLIIDSLWSVAMLIKHGIFALMVALSAYIQGIILPELDRMVLLEEKGKSLEGPGPDKLRKRLRIAMTVNLGLGILVLLFTAIMTAV